MLIPSEGLGLPEIALALGVSSKLLGGLMHRPEHHYRVFEIPKATGGTRKIHSPRTFMKVTQYFILDYLLRRLKAHPAATAYGAGCSVRKNAEMHVGNLPRRQGGRHIRGHRSSLGLPPAFGCQAALTHTAER